MHASGSARPCHYGPVRPSGSAAGFLPTLSTIRECFATSQGFFDAPEERLKTGAGSQRLSSARWKSPNPFRGDLAPPAHKPAPVVVGVCDITSEDWLRANTFNYRRSESSRRHAELFRRDTSRLIQSEEQLTRRSQADTSRWIGQRITDVSFWRSELGFELDQLLRDTGALREVKMRLDKALTESEGPLQVARECLYQRHKRVGGERVHDVVEKNLVQEVAVISSCQGQLERVRDQVKKQLESNRRVQHQLETDMNDKRMALQIDGRCQALGSAKSAAADFFPDLNRLDTSVSVPASWARYSEDNAGWASSERRASREALSVAERTLAAAAREMRAQYDRVNAAFAYRIGQTQHAKNTLQQHLAMTMKEMQQMERTISELEGCVREKRTPLRVAQTRLEERRHRPNMELCKDAAQTRLLAEVACLQATVASLAQRLSEAHASFQLLAAGKADLEHELFAKAHALYIDQDHCMRLRKTHPGTPGLTHTLS